MQAFVGRSHEVARLRGAIAAAASRSGRLILLSGAAGIGKSSLADHTAQLAAELGLRVARGHAVDDEGMPPLWPWHRVARDLPELAAPLAVDLGDAAVRGGAVARFQMFDTVTEALAAQGPLLVILEDLHWADHTSLLLLRHLTAELPRLRLLVVATFRDRTGDTLATHLAPLLQMPATQELALRGLSAAEVAYWLTLVAPTLGGDAAAQLHSRTGGNPLYVRLVVESHAAAVDFDPATPPAVRRLATAQLGRLGGPAQAVVQAASVLGEHIDPALLQLVADTTVSDVADCLDQAAAVGVLHQRAGGALAFTHALVRDAVYAEIPPSVRASLHRRVALAAEAAEATLPAGIVATHWRQAGGADAHLHCGRWARVAAQQAFGATAYEEAAQLTTLALDVAGPDPALRAELMVDLAQARFAVGRVTDSLEHCLLGADLAEQAGRPDLVAAAALVVEGVGTPRVISTVDRLCARALHLLPADGHGALRARLLARRALCASENGEDTRARDLSAQALALARHEGNPDALLDSIHARHLTISAPQYVAERRVLAEQAIAVGWDAHQPLSQLWGHVWNVDIGLQLGDLTLVDTALGQIAQVATTRRLPLAAWHFNRLSATRAALTGDFEQANALTEAALAIALKVGDDSLVGLYHAFHAQMDVLRGHLDTVQVAQRLELLSAAPQMLLVRGFAPLAWALAGDLATARTAFEEFRTLPTTLQAGPRWGALLNLIGVVAVALDDVEVAESVYAAFAPLEEYYTCDGSGAVFCAGSFARPLGDLAFTVGRTEAAISHYRKAVAMDGRIGARPFVALDKLGLARALLHHGAPGDTRAARLLLQEAAREFRALGLTARLRTADALLSELDRATKQANPLTAREAEVSRLVAAGLSNLDIAQRLVLSERTVESHVRNILTKLALPNRTGIAAWLISQDRR